MLLITKRGIGWLCGLPSRKERISPRSGLPHYLSIAARIFLILPLGLALSDARASHLPDAASKIGTIFINQDAQFTTNTLVTLRISAVSTGSSVEAMRFSNDDRTWSAPESYKRSKSWRLEDGDYPPRMNTVLRTVYAQFRGSNGKWSRAVSDSILLARSPADVPQVHEVWITQKRPTDYRPDQPLGSRRNPHIVPAADNEVHVDSLLYSLMTNYSRYYPVATGTNTLGPAANQVTLTLHLGAGTYETHGDDTGNGATLAWSPKNGWRIIGAGKHATVLKAVHFHHGEHRSVIGHYTTATKAVGWYHNVEISDLTVDANLHEGGSNDLRAALCMNFVGNNVQIRRVKAMNAGTTIPGFESMLIQMHNFGAAEDGTHNIMVEDCDLVQAQVGNAYPSGMLGITGQYGPDGNLYEFDNVVIRNCYIDGAAYDGNTPVDRALYSVWDRGRFGIGVGGARNAIVEDNVVMNVVDGYYLDSVGLHDVRVSNNHFRNVCFGFDLQLQPNGHPNQLDTYEFNGNLVELDPRFFPVRDTWQTVGRRYGFRTGGDVNAAERVFNHMMIVGNTFQFTGQTTPENNVEGYSGFLQAFHTINLVSNLFVGPLKPLYWDIGENCLRSQTNVANGTPWMVLNTPESKRQDGTVLGIYPYVLDNLLPFVSVIAGQDVVFQAPIVGTKAATTVLGLPTGATIGSNGIFHWKSKPGDVGTYVLTFCGNAGLMEQPKRTLLTVLPSFNPNNSEWISAGLVGFWRFDEQGGTSLKDSSGNGVNINVSSAAVSSGLIVPGQEALLPGDYAIRINSATNVGWALGIPNPDASLFAGLPPGYHPLLDAETSLYHPFAFSLWFKAEAPSDRIAMLLSRGSGFFLNVKPHRNDPQFLGLSFANPTADISVNTPTNITTHTWHQVVAVYDGVSAQIFVDGLKAGEDTFGQLTDWTPDQWLGFANGGSLDGIFNDLMLWNRALAPDEIARLYELQSKGLTPPITPLAPSTVVASTTPEGDVRLHWEDNSSNETGYLVERSDDGVNFSVAASLPRNATSFLDAPEASGNYTYRVTATNNISTSGYALEQPAIDYHVVTNRITLLTIGLGAIQPLDFSGNTLEIGHGYTAAALPANGFAFDHWSDGFGTILGQASKIRFTMQPKLTLVAHFKDIQRPQLRITSPPNNASLATGFVEITGAALDNGTVTNVWVSLNGKAFQRPRTSNNWTNWTLSQQQLTTGTNLIQAYAQDASRGLSPTSTVRVVFFARSPIHLSTTGQGGIKRYFLNDLLEVGKSYSVAALPKAGFVFSNWSGSLSSEGSLLRFVMRSNMVLQANFVPNPFIEVKGAYYGLFTSEPRVHEQSGSCSLYLNEQGGYSARLRLGGIGYRFSGKFDLEGRTAKTLPQPGGGELRVTVSLDLTPGADRLFGTIATEEWSADLFAVRKTFHPVTNPANALAGRYTLILPGTPQPGMGPPQGNGFGAVSVTTAGRVVLSGFLGDSSPFTQSTYLSRDGFWPLYRTLDRGHSSILGWLTFGTNQPPGEIHGVVNWIKRPNTMARYYPAGFTNDLVLEGSRYIPPPTAATRVLNLTNAAVRFEGGNLSGPLTNWLRLIVPGNRFASTNAITLKVATNNGTFTGRMIPSPGERPSLIRGAVFQSLSCAYGFTSGTNQTGELFMYPE